VRESGADRVGRFGRGVRNVLKLTEGRTQTRDRRICRVGYAADVRERGRDRRGERRDLPVDFIERFPDPRKQPGECQAQYENGDPEKDRHDTAADRPPFDR